MAAGSSSGRGRALIKRRLCLLGDLEEARPVGLLTDSLTVGHHRLRHLDGDASVILLQILEADLQVQLTGAGDNVLARLLDWDLYQI